MILRSLISSFLNVSHAFSAFELVETLLSMLQVLFAAFFFFSAECTDLLVFRVMSFTPRLPSFWRLRRAALFHSQGG